MNHREPLPRALMLLIALIQGLCLLLLHQAIELKHWPHNAPQWLFALYSLVFIWPVMLLLNLAAGNTRAVVAHTLPFALLAGLLGYYAGSQTIPLEHIHYHSLLASYVLTMTVATFMVLIYTQPLIAKTQIHYRTLFRLSWRYFLTLALALLFALGFWLILMLWGALFRAIGIDFFKWLFNTPWFYYPITALASGIGIIIFRNQSHVIDTIVRLQQALMTFLLVLLVVVSLLFLAALPFTGLQPLWKSGGSALILWMQALMLFFVNAVYQDDREQRPYPLWLHRFISLGIAVLPVYSAIAFYGLSQRVQQYGWSLDRCWAFLIWFLLALFPLGYWWGIATRRDGWVRQLDRVNIGVGILMLGAMLLVNSPLLDFRRIVVGNQLQRLTDGRLDIADLDIAYFRWQLARAGYEALQAIKEQYGETEPGVVVRIDELYRDPTHASPSVTVESFQSLVQVVGDEPPLALWEAIHQQEQSRLAYTRQYYLLPVDLDEDGQDEYLLAAELRYQLNLGLYYLDGQQWDFAAMTSLYPRQDEDLAAFIQALKNGQIELIRPRWHDIQIQGKRSRVETEPH